MIEVTYAKPTATVMPNGEKPKAFPLNQEQQKCDYSHHSCLLYSSKNLARIIRQEKEIIEIQIGREEVKPSLLADDTCLSHSFGAET